MTWIFLKMCIRNVLNTAYIHVHVLPSFVFFFKCERYFEIVHQNLLCFLKNMLGSPIHSANWAQS